MANQIVWENRPIRIQSVTHEEALKLPLRKIPPVQTGSIRLIDIENFDLTACGGTHVSRTGGVGIIKIVKLERSRGNVRIEFRCGGRALADYNNKNVIVPFSNWQGPVWPIANYLYSLALKHYGFDNEVKWLAFTLGKLLAHDIDKWGSMHENYHADTGAQ